MTWRLAFIGFLICAALSGCAASLAVGAPANRELAATILFVAGDLPLDRGAGIYSVGDHDMGGVMSVHVAPGTRRIGFLCPRVLYVDDPPTVSRTFQGGHTYEMSCSNGKPRFKRTASRIGADQTGRSRER